MAKVFDPYHVWLGIPSHEQSANRYRLLGITLFESDSDVIENAAEQRMIVARPTSCDALLDGFPLRVRASL